MSLIQGPVVVQVDFVRGEASGSEGQDVLESIENAIGSPFSDTLIGDSGPNELGRDGKDYIVGRGGPDSMDGGRGLKDMVVFDGAPSGVTVGLHAGFATGWGTDSLDGFEWVIGSKWNDRLAGGSAANYLVGLSGNDTLEGWAVTTSSWATPGSTGSSLAQDRTQPMEAEEGRELEPCPRLRGA